MKTNIKYIVLSEKCAQQNKHTTLESARAYARSEAYECGPQFIARVEYLVHEDAAPIVETKQ